MNGRDKTVVTARDNPFAMRFVEQIPYRFDDGDWSSHLQRLEEMRFRASIVGPHGTGKTTLLEQTARRLEDRVHIQLEFVSRDRAVHRRWMCEVAELSADGTVVCVDGIERLSVWHRAELFRATRPGPGLIYTAHRRCRFPVWILRRHTAF